MLNHVSTFFYPVVLTYSYNQPKELVIAKITEVLNEKVTLLSSNDMTGRFLSEDTFAINTVSPIQGVLDRSTLVGQIIQSKHGMTEIRTRAKTGLSLYVIFFTTLIFGVLSLYKFIQTSSIGFLFSFLASFFFGPALSIGLSNISIYSVRQRYKMYIDKALRT